MTRASPDEPTPATLNGWVGRRFTRPACNRLAIATLLHDDRGAVHPELLVPRLRAVHVVGARASRREDDRLCPLLRRCDQHLRVHPFEGDHVLHGVTVLSTRRVGTPTRK